MVTVTAGPSSRDLVELSTVKDELGITDSSYNSQLVLLINMVSEVFAGTHGLRRELWRQGYEERLAGRGGVFLSLSRWPIESIASIEEDGVAVAPASYAVGGGDRSRVYRSAGWRETPVSGRAQYATAGDEALSYTVAYTAGWLMPGEVDLWSSSRAYGLGAWVRSSSATSVFRFECTTAGTSGASEPVWPVVEGGTVADGSAVWTARAASELPRDLELVALMQVVDWFRGGLSVPAGLSERRTGEVSVKYDVEATRAGFVLLPAAVAVLRGYR